MLFMLGAVILIGYIARLDSLALFLLQHFADQPSKNRSFQLSSYRVSIEAKPLPGLTDASGLTYHAPSKTLFAVLNHESLIVQLSLSGEILRKIRVEGAADMEDITHVRDLTFVLADEYHNRLYLVDLEKAGASIDARFARQAELAFDKNGNKNFEGVAWDQKNQRLLVVKEKNPKRLLEIRGFVDPEKYKTIRIHDLGQSYPLLAGLRDMAAVNFHEPSGHLLVLSEESKLIKEFDREGNYLSSLLLWRGFHGIRHSIPQPEGIAVGPDNSLYVISEPNLFYVFSPSKSLNEPETGLKI